MRSFTSALACAHAVALAACGSNPPKTTVGEQPPRASQPSGVAAEVAPEPAPPPPAYVVGVTIASAQVAGRMPNGEHWDAKNAGEAEPDPAMVRYLARHPELREHVLTVGVPIGGEEIVEASAKSVAADPMVLVEIGDAVYRSPVVPRAFHPVWDFRFRFLYGNVGDRAGVAPTQPVRIRVVDFDGAGAFDTLGTAMLTADELVSDQLHELGPFGSVESLVLTVVLAPVPETTVPRQVRLAVPGKSSWTDAGVNVVAGDRVLIEAADEVCTKGDNLHHCSGPEGQRMPNRTYNLDGFKEQGHGALVAAIGDTRFLVGRKKSFIAASTGPLRLGVNDRDTDNNRGSYAVRITVQPLPE